MGYYVSIDKVREDDDLVVYRYSDGQLPAGEVQFDKRKGELRLRDLGDDPGKRAYLKAAAKVHKNWVSGEPFHEHLDHSS